MLTKEKPPRLPGGAWVTDSMGAQSQDTGSGVRVVLGADGSEVR